MTHVLRSSGEFIDVELHSEVGGRLHRVRKLALEIRFAFEQVGGGGFR